MKIRRFNLTCSENAEQFKALEDFGVHVVISTHMSGDHCPVFVADRPIPCAMREKLEQLPDGWTDGYDAGYVCICDGKGNLITFDPDEEKGELSVHKSEAEWYPFTFFPTKEGIRDAKKLIDGLKAWIDGAERHRQP